MSTEENRAIALKFIESMSGGQMDMSLLTDDAQWWVPGAGLMTKAQFFALAGMIAAKVKGKPSFKVHGVTAENDRVVVEAEARAEMADGRTYNNTYHFLFTFRDGKICLSKEYNDTRHAAEIFGV